MDILRFYEVLEERLGVLAQKLGIDNLEKYYTLTDNELFKQSVGKEYEELEEVNKVVVRFAFHAQNAQRRMTIIKFLEKFKEHKENLCGFDPIKIIEKFNVLEDFDVAVKKLVEEFRKYLTWNSEKNKTEKRDSIVSSFAKPLLSFCKYLVQLAKDESTGNIDFSNIIDKIKKDLIPQEDCEDEIKIPNYKEIIKKFQKRVQGIGFALSCDFLKELDEEFDFVKPDIHIKDILKELCGVDVGKNVYKIMDAFYELYKKLRESIDITAYQFDRMIWLVCTEKFFLDKVSNLKGNDGKKYLINVIRSESN